jgi:hypothetical protein
MGLSRQVARSIPDAPAHAYRMQRWYAAYMAALFEYDRARIDGRIYEAEMAIRSRQRELIPGDAERMEQRALFEALHALVALHACVQH